MTNFYSWLLFFHLVGLTAFLFAHGVSGGASLAVRAQASTGTRQLLRLAQRSNLVANPSLLLVIVTGISMAFAGHWWGQGWVWASLVVLTILLVAMALIARPYKQARAAADQADEVIRERLGHTRPLTAVWVGAIGLAALLVLMVFKPF